MRIRLKLTLALALLFVMMILLGGVGTYYLRWLAKDAEAIIQDNYRSLTYMRSLDHLLDDMQQLLITRPSAGDSLRQIQEMVQQFESQLKAQQENITEPGERMLTDKVVHDFANLQQRIAAYPAGESHWQYYRAEVQPVMYSLEEQIAQIYELNEETILRKNAVANLTAEKVILYMAVFCLSGIVVGLIFTVGLPAYIARPISKFNQGIREIAYGNYQYKLPVDSVDEFGELAISFNRMAAKLKEYEQSNLAHLLFEKQRLSAVINQMNEAIIGLDENKYIIFANSHALQLLGLQETQLVGRYAPDVATVNALMHNLISELMIDFEEWEEKKFRQLRVVVGKKEKLYSKNIVDVVEQPTGENRKVLIGHVIILNDVTEFAEKDVAKTHFIATLSHELKTPVAAIEMSLGLIANSKVGPLNQEQQQLIQTIEDNNARIKRSINEVLDLAKIENGTIDVSPTAEEPKRLIEEALQGIELFLQDKQLELLLDIPALLPEVHTDAHKTVWILNNILTNAIRYSPPHGTIKVKAERETGAVAISVEDQGPGLSAEEQKLIFKKFSRLNNKEQTGAGLGLAISKEFIEAMGGNIGVHSKKGQGTCFWIKIPLFHQQV